MRSAQNKLRGQRRGTGCWASYEGLCEAPPCARAEMRGIEWGDPAEHKRKVATVPNCAKSRTSATCAGAQASMTEEAS
eukprot:scaffold584_cov121-Isochrysis_galbana.AAC.2